jgi:uncharacterized protein (DUF885 family)
VKFALGAAASVGLGLGVAGCPAPMPPAPVSSPSASSSAPASRDDAAIVEAERAYLDLYAELHPETATSMGLHTRDSDLDDRSRDGIAKRVAREAAMLAELQARFGQVVASPSAKVDLALLESALSVEIRTEHDLRPEERQPDWYAAPLNTLFLMKAREYAPAKERATASLARIEKLPSQLLLAEAQLTTPPRVWTLVGIERAKAAPAFFEDEREFLDRELVDRKAGADAAIERAKAAFVRYATFLEQTILPRSNGDYAAGADLFGWLLRENYFIRDTPDQLMELGNRLIAKTNAEMTAVAKRIDPNATSWPEVASKLKAKHPTAADLLPTYKSEVARAKQFLVEKRAVPFPPDDSLAVMDTPPYERTTIIAEYEPPAPFGVSTKGIFFVTPVDPAASDTVKEEMLRENDSGDIVDTVVHEAYPGHHLQESFAFRHPSIIRRADQTSLFAEGWGLYAEELMSELGYYTDEQRLMQLEWTLVRAVRIVIDVGLHTRGMSFEEGVRQLTDIAHLERTLAESEVKRYTLSPTQPLSYLVGREMIFRMREKYKAREGDKFTLARFHADLLSHGTIPPGLIAREMFSEE